MLVALAIASAGAVSAAGIVLLVALGLGLYARHWLSLADRSRVGARSEDEVRCALASLEPDGWRLRHSLAWQGGGNIDSLAIAPTGVGFSIVGRAMPAEQGRRTRLAAATTRGRRTTVTTAARQMTWPVSLLARLRLLP
jgi:hypothetical protein